jgi:hypothetical protein
MPRPWTSVALVASWIRGLQSSCQTREDALPGAATVSQIQDTGGLVRYCSGVRALAAFAILPALSGCVIDGRSDAEKAWDDASRAEKQELCIGLFEAVIQTSPLVDGLVAGGLSQEEAMEFVSLLWEKCNEDF